MLESVTVSWTAIVVAAVVNMIIGFIWYQPMVFGKMWMEATGKTEMKPNPVHMLFMLLISGAIAYVMAHFVAYTGATDYMTGAQTGFWIGLAFLALPLANSTLGGTGTWKLWGVNAGYWLVALMVMGGIIASY